MVYHWERAQGSLFIIQQATRCNSHCPGLVPIILSKLIHAQRCASRYIIYTTAFLVPCCDLLPAHQLTDATQQKLRCFSTFSLPVGFYLCNQGFQRQEASLEGSVMKRGSVCPAAWNSKCIEVNSSKQQKQILGGQGKKQLSVNADQGWNQCGVSGETVW